MEVETPERKTLNNALVTTNEVLNITWKLSASHAPHIRNTKITQDSRIILATGLKLENQHTRRTLGTLSWVYKPSDYPRVIGSRALLVGRTSRKTYGQLKPSGVETHIPPPRCNSFNDCFGQAVLTSDSVTATF